MYEENVQVFDGYPYNKQAGDKIGYEFHYKNNLNYTI